MSKAQTRRGRRWHRYREIAHVLWEERVFSLSRGSEIESHAPGPITADDALVCPPDDVAGPGFEEGGADSTFAVVDADHLEEAVDEKHLPRQIRIRHALERLGPAFVKLGQILSTRRDLIDPALAAELTKLQDHVPTVPWEEMAGVVEQELGGTVDELYGSFDPEPIASASIAQVYKATLHDGRTVAVKVQRPGVIEVMDTDLDILVTQAHFIVERTSWGRDQNVAGIVDDIVRVLRAELDYLHEARNLARFREAFAEDHDVFFPEPIWDLTSRRVLTMEYVEGVPGSRLESDRETGVDTRRMVEVGVDCYFRQILDLGFYHADPHAGNLFAMPDGRVGFVDFGRVAAVSRSNRSAVFEFLLSVLDDDPLDATEALLAMAAADPTLEVAVLQTDMRRILSLYREGQTRPDALQRTLQELLSLTRRHRLALPGEIVVLMTTMGVLEGVARQIEPTFDLLEAARPFAERYVVRTLGPQSWTREIGRALRRYRRLLEDLPVALTRALRRASEGEFRLAVRPEHYEELIRGLEEVANRLAFALLLSAFVLAFAYVSAQESLPDWIQAVAAVILVLAALVAIVLLGSLLLAMVRRFRENRRRRR
jgi:ubiquinone biosynthesis protein